jgi:voltage-gated potassium channel
MSSALHRVQSALHLRFHQRSSPQAQRLDRFIYLLIGLSVLFFTLDVFLGAEHPWSEPLHALDGPLTGLFVVEYLLRLGSYRPPTTDFLVPSAGATLRVHVVGRIRYMFAPSMMVDLLCILAVWPPLRGLRAIRLLRLLRARRIFRYSNPFDGLLRAFADNRLLFFFALSLVGCITVVGGLAIYLAEVGTNPHVTQVRDGLWWALVTLTTVGYGDISPATGLGRGIGAVLMVSGMFSLALFAGLVGSTLVNVVMGIREEQYRMSGLVNHLVVCNYEPGARMLLDAVLDEFDLEQTPVILFSPGERPNDVPPEFGWVSGDPTKESELDKARIAHARAVMVIGPRSILPQHADAQTILTIFTVRAFARRRAVARKHPLRVLAEILDAENVGHATAAGADEVVETTRLGFALLAHALAEPGTGAIMGAVAAAGAHSMFVGRAPEILAGSRFGDVSHAVKARTGALVVGVRSTGGVDRINPPDDTELAADCLLIYLAERPVLASV